MAKPVPTTTTGTIAAGTSLSPSIDLTAGAVVMLISPANWGYIRNVTFQASIDNVAFYDVFDNTGFEVVRPVVPGAIVELASSLTQSAMYLKIRSGRRDDPLAVDADSIFTLVLA
jgi:hypothetical protein